MQISTFDDDLLDLSEFADRLERFLSTEQNYVHGGLVVALTSDFGNGKTTFLRMWQDHIDRRDDEDDEKPLVVSLNAWESDYFGDPLFAIVSSLVEALEGANESTKKLIDAAQKVGWFATAILGQVTANLSGIDAAAAGEYAEQRQASRDGREELSSDAFSSFEHRKKAMNHLKQVIQEYVSGCDRMVLFIVDELDRCRPDYAISYLETIKHIFDVPGSAFILAIDRQQLENSAKAAFGGDLNFNEYLRKFVHREVPLPELSEESFKRIADKYADYYLVSENLRHCYMKVDQQHRKLIKDLLYAFKTSPRQTQEIFRILGHSLSIDESRSGNILWGLAAGSIFMAVLSVCDNSAFHKFGKSQLTPKETFEYLKSKFNNKFDLHLEQHLLGWWFCVILTGGGVKLNKDDRPDRILIDVGVIQPKQIGTMTSEDLKSAEKELGRYQSAWHYSGEKRFKQIYVAINQIQQWT